MIVKGPVADPEVFHITHVNNLPSILADGKLWSHSAVLASNKVHTTIGYQHIKRRRLERTVPVGSGGNLGDYVPFYFCPRSVMLYVIHMANSPALGYVGGQGPVVHLVSTAKTLAAMGRPWAFTERHAELGYAQYYDNLALLGQIDWGAVAATKWNQSDDLKEKKQAEFLVHEWCPWAAIKEVGVIDAATAAQVQAVLARAGSTLPVAVHRDWYY